MPFEVSVNAQIALRELSKAVNKRSYSWARIRPLGDVYVGRAAQSTDQNSLSNPELLSKLKEELKAQVRAELEAELAAEAEEKPKRKKKATIEDDSMIASPSESPFYTEEQLNNLPL